MSYELTIRDREGSLEATFVPDVGMICSSLRHDGEELLAQGDGLTAYQERGSTFAVPLLYPWANRLSAWSYTAHDRTVELSDTDPLIHVDGATGLPIHGLLAASPHWTVVDADLDKLTAELDFGAQPDYVRDFPFPHAVRYDASIANHTLVITITVTAAPGDGAVPVSFGFHPYLTLPGSDRSEWQIELPVASRAILDEHMIPTGETDEIAPGELDGALGDRTFDTAFDRLHIAPEDRQPSFTVADARRRIAVEFRHGYEVAQVFAPEGSEFICFEPMTAAINALRTGVGLKQATASEPFSAEFAISVS